MTLHIELLDDQDVAKFDSGNDRLDEWLRRHARTATGQGTRTHLLVDDDGSVVGYFALAPHLLERTDASKRLARGAPRQIPAILLAKLAIDSTCQGQGLGSELLVHALGVAVAAARSAGGRVVLVDAIDANARAFYEHHDFELLPGGTTRLVMKLSTAAKALGLPWP